MKKGAQQEMNGRIKDTAVLDGWMGWRCSWLCR